MITISYFEFDVVKESWMWQLMISLLPPPSLSLFAVYKENVVSVPPWEKLFIILLFWTDFLAHPKLSRRCGKQRK